MNDGDKSLESYRSLLLLTELEREESLSQRELAQRLGIALGLVNSYLKNLVSKGFIRVTSFPRNRYGYLLTPQGMAEKSRLAYRHLSYFTNLYTVTRQDYRRLFLALADEQVREVAFCGVDEVAEIAYLSMRECGLELALIVDEQEAGRDFFGHSVRGVHALAGNPAPSIPIVITSLKRGAALRSALLAAGVQSARIRHIQTFQSEQEES